MRRLLLPVILVLLVSAGEVPAQRRPARRAPKTQPTARPVGRVRWMKTTAKALAAARKADAPVFLFAHLDKHAPSDAFARKLLADDTFRRLSKLFVMLHVVGDAEKDLMDKFGVQAYPTIVFLDSAGEKVYALDATATPKKVSQYMARTFLISMHNSGKRLKDAGRVRRAFVKFKWVEALGPGTPPAKWSARELRRIQADGIKKLSQAAIAKDEKDYLKTMALLDELVYEYRGTNAGDQATRAMIKLLKEPETARAYREVVRRQIAERKLRYARRLHTAQDLQNALIIYWNVSRDYPKTPAADVAAKRAEGIVKANPGLVEKTRAVRLERDCRHWMEMARAFEMNKRPDKALQYYRRILKHYPDTPWAAKAKAERDRLLAAKPGK